MTQAFLVWDMGASGRGDNGRLTPSQKYKKGFDCSGVDRRFEPEGHKEPRHFLVTWAPMGGGKGNLPPKPLLEYENVLISVAYPGFLN